MNRFLCDVIIFSLQRSVNFDHLLVGQVTVDGRVGRASPRRVWQLSDNLDLQFRGSFQKSRHFVIHLEPRPQRIQADPGLAL